MRTELHLSLVPGSARPRTEQNIEETGFAQSKSWSDLVLVDQGVGSSTVGGHRHTLPNINVGYRGCGTMSAAHSTPTEVQEPPSMTIPNIGTPAIRVLFQVTPIYRGLRSTSLG